jgi:hypothetical protein
MSEKNLFQNIRGPGKPLRPRSPVTPLGPGLPAGPAIVATAVSPR